MARPVSYTTKAAGNVIDAAHVNQIQTDVGLLDTALATAETAIAREGGTFYPETYGAVGNGTTNDATAFQSALTAAGAVKGTVVLRPGKTYAIGAPLIVPSNVRISGYGAKLLCTDPVLGDQINHRPFLSLSNVSNVVIEGLELDGQKALWAGVTEFKYGIWLVRASKVALRDIWAHDWKGDGVYLNEITGFSTPNSDIYGENLRCTDNHRQGMSISSAQRATFVRCTFSGSAGTNPQAGVDIEPYWDYSIIEDITFFGCSFNGNAQSGFNVLNHLSPTVVQGNIKVIGCTAKGNANAGYNVVVGNDVTFRDCHARENGLEGFRLGDNKASDVRIVGGTVHHNQQRGITIVPQIAGAELYDITVSGVTVGINSLALVGTHAGMQIGGAVGVGTVGGIVVSDCVIGETGYVSQSYGIYVGYEVFNLRLHDNDLRGNTVAGLAFATTTDKSGVHDNIGYVTNTRGATSIADGGSITHGLADTPTSVRVSGSVAGEFVSVTARAFTTFTCAIKTHAGAVGTTQTVYWEASF